MVMDTPICIAYDALAGDTEEDSLLRFTKLRRVLPVSLEFAFVISKLLLHVCVMSPTCIPLQPNSLVITLHSLGYYNVIYVLYTRAVYMFEITLRIIGVGVYDYFRKIWNM
jgi:hypothetical protein